MSRLIILGLGVMLSFAVNADWKLDNEASALAFVSVKNGVIAESHTFRALSGTVTKSGEASLEVLLASLETLLPIRNERMRDLLFEVAKFPVATFTTTVDLAGVTGMAVGESHRLELQGKLAMHGKSSDITAPVSVVRVDSKAWLITSTRPVLISTSTFGLDPGVEALREIAGLTGITPVAPVTFQLMFRWDD